MKKLVKYKVDKEKSSSGTIICIITFPRYRGAISQTDDHKLIKKMAIECISIFLGCKQESLRLLRIK